MHRTRCQRRLDLDCRNGIVAADRVLEALDRMLYKLAKCPGIGHQQKELADKRYRTGVVNFWLAPKKKE